MGFVETVGHLAFPTDTAPVALRVVIALLSVLLLGAGTRLGRHGPRVAVLLAGALASVAAVDAAETPARYYEPTAFLGIACIGAAIALWLEKLGYRAALFVAGVVVGAMYAVAIRDTFGATGSPYFAGVGAIVVGVVLPWVFETIPRICSPFVGAAGLAWAVGRPDSLPLLIGVWGVGVTVQMFTGPSEVDLDDEERAPAR